MLFHLNSRNRLPLIPYGDLFIFVVAGCIMTVCVIFNYLFTFVSWKTKHISIPTYSVSIRDINFIEIMEFTLNTILEFKDEKDAVSHNTHHAIHVMYQPPITLGN